MSWTSIVEARKRSNGASREHLVRFMVELSGNASTLHYLAIQPAEIRNALRRQYLSAGVVEAVRPSLLRRGVGGAAFGEEPAYPPTGNHSLDRIIHAAISSPEMTVQTILGLDDTTFAAMRNPLESAMQTIAEERGLAAHLSLEEKERRVFDTWVKATTPLLNEALSSLGGHPSEFQAWITHEDNLRRFCLDVPSLDVLRDLAFTRDRNPQQPTEPNDALDWLVLQTGIPYVNIVVTENLWAHYANRVGGLAARYGTRVLADAEKLPGVLAENGCL
jgi:hypothetical protein